MASHHPIRRPSRVKDVAGRRFGRLVALRIVGEDRHRRKLWECQCDCGGTSVVMIGNLTSGNSTSCGCMKGAPRHGYCGTPTHRSWSKMISRCTNPNSNVFRNYGGRGIRVCERWLDFAVFLEDMGERPEGATLDRIDNNRGYEPGNCRWATARQQINNRRRTRYLTHNGVTLPLSEWAEQAGISANALAQRVFSLGWSVERALSTPIGGARQ